VLFNEFAEDHRVSVYDPPPELRERLRSGPTRGNVTCYSYFQGLEPGQSPGQTSNTGLEATFEVAAHMRVRPGRLEQFQAQAAELMRLTRQLDTQTLRYDWFLSEDCAECDVREAYVCEAGLFEHNAHVREARDQLFRDAADNHVMTVYGEASPQLVDLLRAHAAGARWLRYFQGLEPSPSPR
jgi:quinol monooxygenase YgiN